MTASDLAGWIAPTATMIAAMMTAANLGARVTGWGFVIFVVGSVCWSIVGMTTGQTNLIAANVFLTFVNVVGVWRWLGRQAKYEQGGQAAARQSTYANVPTLFSAASLVGSKLIGDQACAIGVVVDTMVRCDDRELAYVVVSEGGISGLGEQLHALDPTSLQFKSGSVHCALTAEALAALPVLQPDHWPETLAVVMPQVRDQAHDTGGHLSVACAPVATQGG